VSDEIHVSGIRRSFGPRRALQGVSLLLRAGEILGLVGPNGAGKSTLFRVIAGALRADDPGEPLTYGGGQPVPAAQIGYAPEEPLVYEELTVGDQVRFAARLHRLSRNSLGVAAAAAIARAGLDGMENRLVGTLSKGYRQRVGLAQALVAEPRLLLLDEPTSGMDPNQVVDFHRMLADIQPDRFIVYSSHQIDGVVGVAGRVAILESGRLVGLVRVDTSDAPWRRLSLTGGPAPSAPDATSDFSWFLSRDGSALYLQEDALAVSPEWEIRAESECLRFSVADMFALATRD
jgi:ABC-2 type transport system ATP-binding protein